MLFIPVFVKTDTRHLVCRPSLLPAAMAVFDTLLSKLQNLDFSQGALDWFQSYLSNRQQCVRIGDAVSKVLSLEFRKALF